MPSGSRENARPVALAAVAAGKTYQQAARDAGVHERTVGRWASEPEWREELYRRQEDAFAKAVEELSAASADAVATLRTLMRESKSDMVKLSAARAVLDVGLRFREEFEFRKRLDSLERDIHYPHQPPERCSR